MRRIYATFIALLITLFVSAQGIEKTSYQTVSINKSTSIHNWDTSYGLYNHSGFYNIIDYLPLWIHKTREPGLPVISVKGNFNWLVINPGFLKSIRNGIEWNGIAKSISAYPFINTYNANGTYLILDPMFINPRDYYDLISKSPWLLDTNPWINDTFWTALLRNSYLYFNHRK